MLRFRSRVDAGLATEPADPAAPAAPAGPGRRHGHGLSLSGRGHPLFRCHGDQRLEEFLGLWPTLGFLSVPLPSKFHV